MARSQRWWVAAACAVASACSSSSQVSSPLATPDASTGDAPASDAAVDGGDESGVALPPFMPSAQIFVDGFANYAANLDDCRAGMCAHNENTDMISWNGAIYLVHRTAHSQVLGSNSSLHIYRSTDDGATFTQTAVILAPLTPIDADDTGEPAGDVGRDIRDPHFYVTPNADGTTTLRLKTLTRWPVTSSRDSNVNTIAVGSSSTDGATWTPLVRLGPTDWSFWRIKENAGVYYSAAYEDGDQAVYLFTSTDGVTWTKGAKVYDVSADTPLETELVFVPSGKLLALVRTDGDDDHLLGNVPPIKTMVCWASPPFSTFDCPSQIDGQRLDGPLAFYWNSRLFVIARRQLLDPVRYRKRTALFELTGALDGGDVGITWWGDLPSAGDTSYAGYAMTDATHAIVSWYSGDVGDDLDWLPSMLGPTNIWLGTIDFSTLVPGTAPDAGPPNTSY